MFLPPAAGPLPTSVVEVPELASHLGDVAVPTGPIPSTEDTSLKEASGHGQFPAWGASRTSIPGITPLLSPDRPTCTKVIDLRGQVNCAHKVRLQTPLGLEVVHPVALVVQSTVGDQQKSISSPGNQVTMAGVDTVLEEVDKLLEEEGLASSLVPSRIDEPVEIQSEREEPLVPTSFAVQA